MTKWIAVVALVVGLCTAAMAGDKACDLKKIEKAKVCASCKAIDPKLDDKGQCCGAVPKEADVCIKECYECSACKKNQAEDKPCSCGAKDAKNAKVVVKALVIFKCEGCGAAADKEGKCGKAECGKQIKKACSKSGEFPHGGS